MVFKKNIYKISATSVKILQKGRVKMENITDMSHCMLCPRNCGVDRRNSTGYCKCTDKIKAALASVHMWEEPPISGTRGSGTVFFSGCSLRCVFCQNYDISQENNGIEITTERLSDIFIEQQNRNVHNINLVTAGHFLPQVAYALKIAKKKGLKIPVVYNSGGYEKVEALKLLDGLVDIYIPDIKFFSSEISKKYASCENYFEYASKAVKEMFRQTGGLQLDDSGIMKKGIIIRHLILPGCRKDSEKILDFIKGNFGNDVYVSLLNQYMPMYKATQIKELNRRLTTFEYQKVTDYFLDIGLENGFVQEKSSAQKKYTPIFDHKGL
jgi:putative pyruvate formate lyase activating enzyme